MTPQPQAILITESTYPIAVACLAGGFSTIPMDKVLGCVLIINKMCAEQVANDRSPGVLLGNSWMSRYEFDKRFRLSDEHLVLYLNDRFAEIEAI